MLRSTRVCTILVLVFALCGMVMAQAGKIPITTTSEKARDLFIQGRLQAERFRFVDARSLFGQALTEDPNFALALRGMAQAQPDAKNYQDYMDKAVALVDKVSECERLAILADNAGGRLNLVQQRQFLGQLIAACGEDEHGHFSLGLYFYGRQFYDSCAAELTTATTIAPGYVAAWNMLGYAHRSLGDYAKAETAFQKYIELSPKDANAYDSYAELLLKEGKFEDAVTQYRHALSVDTTFVISYYNMAAPLVYLGRYDEARNQLNELMKRARDDGQRGVADFGIAASFVDEGRFDEAVKTIEASNALSEKIHDVATVSGNLQAIGFIRLHEKKYDEALASYQKSVDLVRGSDLSPAIKAVTERNLLYCKARAAAEKGDLKAAQVYADSFAVACTAAGSADDMHAMHALNGVVALEAKQYAKAVEEFKLGPAQNGYYTYRLALAYDGAGNKPKAIEAVTAAAHMNSVLNFNDVLARHEALALAKQWSGKE